jgi:hypothetical protein
VSREVTAHGYGRALVERGRWLVAPGRWERAILIAIAAIVAYQVFCEPIVGTADNRDYWRVMKQIGVGYRESPDPTFFRNIQREYVIVHREPVKYLTSQVLLGRLAVRLNRVVSKDGTFDLCVMGFVNGAAYLAAIAVFLAAFRRHKTAIRVAIGMFALLAFTDVRLVAYLNSFYCEPAQMIFLIATVGLALLVVDDSRALRRRVVLYVAFLACTVLFMFAKTQDLAFAPALAVIAYRIFPSTAPRRLARGAIAVTLVALVVWAMKSDAYAVTNRVNVDVTLDEEILAHSHDQAADLEELGDGDRANVTLTRIATFYLHHPLRWWSMSGRRLHQAFTRTPYGNFELPRTGESTAFDGFSSWKNRHYPRSMWFWISAIAGYLAILGVRWRLGGRHDRTSALIQAMLLVGCILEFVAIVTFEANGTEKHFFVFNVLVDLVIAMAIIEVDAVIALWRARRAAVSAPPREM